MRDASIIVKAEEDENEPKVYKFFRYVRPLDDHPKSFGRVGPRGGVTFYIEFVPDEDLMTFAFTICRDDESFKKQFARDQTMDRYIKKEVFVIEGYDKDSWVVDNILFALHNYLGYSEFGFKPAHYPVELPVFTSVPDSYRDGHQDQTLELLLTRLLRDYVSYDDQSTTAAALEEIQVLKQALHNLEATLLV